MKKIKYIMDERKNPSYLKCIEYCCLLDIVFKVLSIIYNKHILLQIIITQKSPKCGEIFSLDKNIQLCFKLFSIFIMMLGILACVKEDLYDFNKFRLMFFNVYLVLEVLEVLGISMEVAFFKCSQLPLRQRALTSLSMLVSGLGIVFLYFSIWLCFSNRALHYLQTKNNKAYTDEISQLRNYDTFGADDTNRAAPSLSVNPETIPIKTSLVEFENLEDSENRLL